MRFIKITLLPILFLSVITIAAVLQIVNYLSPLENRRSVRGQTKYIILHSSEGNDNGISRNHMRGESNFWISENGTINRIISDEKVAKHAGFSMWDGQTNIDLFSIGIEIVGTYSKKPNPLQIKSLKNLLQILKKKYNIADENILTHSMVAFGRGNRFWPNLHRGRKRCGMLMATEDLRTELGLNNKPDYDPDVRAGRLMVADRYLFDILFSKNTDVVRDEIEKVYSGPQINTISKNRSAWFIARDQYDDKNTLYTFSDGSQKRGNEIENWSQLPLGTKVSFLKEDEKPLSNPQTKSPTANDSSNERTITSSIFKEIGLDGETAYSVVGNEYSKPTTIYFLVDGRIRTGQQLDPSFLSHLKKGTKILQGYHYGGHVSKSRTVFSICQKRWNDPSTYYRLPDGKIMTGDDVDPQSVPNDTLVFYQL